MRFLKESLLITLLVTFSAQVIAGDAQFTVSNRPSLLELVFLASLQALNHNHKIELPRVERYYKEELKVKKKKR